MVDFQSRWGGSCAFADTRSIEASWYSVQAQKTMLQVAASDIRDVRAAGGTYDTCDRPPWLSAPTLLLSRSALVTSSA